MGVTTTKGAMVDGIIMEMAEIDVMTMEEIMTAEEEDVARIEMIEDLNTIQENVAGMITIGEMTEEIIQMIEEIIMEIIEGDHHLEVEEVVEVDIMEGGGIMSILAEAGGGMNNTRLIEMKDNQKMLFKWQNL